MYNFCDTHVNFNFLYESFSHIVEICFLSLSSLGVVGLQPLFLYGPWQYYLDCGVCLGLDLYFVSKFRVLKIERISLQ